MPDVMTFPDAIEEFLNEYSFKDREEIYTNGSDLIPVFRVKQAIDHFFNKPQQLAYYIEHFEVWANGTLFDYSVRDYIGEIQVNNTTYYADWEDFAKEVLEQHSYVASRGKDIKHTVFYNSNIKSLSYRSFKHGKIKHYCVPKSASIDDVLKYRDVQTACKYLKQFM